MRLYWLLLPMFCACGRTVNPGPGPGGATGLTGEMPAILVAHNQARSTVSAALPPMTWSEQIAGSAQSVANDLAARGCQLEHSSTSYGENLYWSSGKSSVTGVVDAWESESKCYTYGRYPDICNLNNGCLACGHYTQVIWRDSTQLGCGMATCDGGAEVWVCHYHPRGNVNGQYPY